METMSQMGADVRCLVEDHLLEFLDVGARLESDVDQTRAEPVALSQCSHPPTIASEPQDK